MSALDLGVSQEELRNLVVELATAKLLEELDDIGALGNTIDVRLNAAIEAHIAPVVNRVAVETIAPRVEALIEGLTFQKTSSYGEPKAPVQTWRELLPGWQYTREEVTSEMIPDLEALAERGVRPTEATSHA